MATQEQIIAAYKELQGLKKADGSRRYSDDEAASLISKSVQDPNAITRGLKMYGGAVVEGAAGTLGMAGTMGSEVIGGINQLLPKEDQLAPDNALLHMGAEPINNLTDSLGITSRIDAQPQSTAERLTRGAFEGLGSAAPLALVAGPEVLPAGVGGGLGSAAADELAPGNPWWKAIGAVLGGAVGGALGDDASALAQGRPTSIQRVIRGIERNPVSTLMSTVAGAGADEMINRLTGIPHVFGGDPLGNALTGGVVGAVAPMVIRGGASILRHPRSLLAPAVGAIGLNAGTTGQGQ